jgi:hypothetical protein
MASTQSRLIFMEYTQADIATTSYMELPTAVNLPNLSKVKHCLRIIKNIYGGKASEEHGFSILENNFFTSCSIYNRNMMNLSKITNLQPLLCSLMKLY